MASVGGSKNTISLNLNPMMDVFSILITFLLMSFSTEPVSHDVNPALELPDSKTMIALDEVPEITVTKNEILVNDKKVANIIGGDVEQQDRAQGAIYPLYVELQKLQDAAVKLAQGPDDKKTSVLTMEMDKGQNFKLMKRIMLSAQQAHFITFKLMVSKEIN